MKTFLNLILKFKAMLNRYDTHNKLLGFWGRIFPKLTANNVDKSDHWHELRDKSGEKVIRLTNSHLTTWDNGLIVFHVSLALLPFNL